MSISQPPRIGPQIGPSSMRDAQDGHQAADPLRTRRASHDRHAERHQHPAAQPLQDPETDQLADRVAGGGGHRADPIVNIANAASMREPLLVPNRSAAQPVNGITVARANVYPVIVQATWA